MVSVGRARNRRVGNRPRVHNRLPEFSEPETLIIGRNRNESRRTRKLECYMEKLDSFLRNMGYPFRGLPAQCRMCERSFPRQSTA